jgi:antitoxin component of MazEF toxin-antitoxin module
MKGQAARWGDGLGVRIPEELADQAGLSEGSRGESVDE